MNLRNCPGVIAHKGLKILDFVPVQVRPGYHKMNDTNTVKDKVDLEVDIQELFLVILGKNIKFYLLLLFLQLLLSFTHYLSNYFQSESILVSKDSSKSSSSLGQYLI